MRAAVRDIAEELERGLSPLWRLPPNDDGKHATDHLQARQHLLDLAEDALKTCAEILSNNRDES
ncbi:hypothetical protein ACQY0O_006231 [Thecaphora frezii]